MSESAQQAETARPAPTERILPDQPADREDPVNLGDPTVWRKLDQELEEAMRGEILEGELPEGKEPPPLNDTDEMIDKLDEAMRDESPEPQESESSEAEADEVSAEDDAEDYDIYTQSVPLTVRGQQRELTVGQLKDVAQEYMHRAEEFKELSAKRESIDEMHVGLYQQRAELQRVMGYLGNQVPQEVAQTLREHEKQFLEQQKQQVLEFKPEWSDPDRFNADRKVIHSFAQRFGINPVEVNNIPDSRFIALLATAAENDAMIKRSVEEAKRIKANPLKKSRAAKKERKDAEAAFAKAAQMGDSDAKWAMLDNVLLGK